MVDGIEEKIIEKVIDEGIDKLSPQKRILSFLKNLFKALIIVRWFASFIMAWFDNVRRAGIMSVMDKYPESKVWKTIMWIKTWRYIYGIIIGLLLAYYYAVDDWLIEFIDTVKELFI